MSHYKILGIPENATAEQIKQAYHKLIAQPSLSEKRRAKIQHAYDILIHPELSQVYRHQTTTLFPNILKKIRSKKLNSAKQLLDAYYRNQRMAILTLSDKLIIIQIARDLAFEFEKNNKEQDAIECFKIVIDFASKVRGKNELATNLEVDAVIQLISLLFEAKNFENIFKFIHLYLFELPKYKNFHADFFRIIYENTRQLIDDRQFEIIHKLVQIFSEAGSEHEQVNIFYTNAIASINMALGEKQRLLCKDTYNSDSIIDIQITYERMYSFAEYYFKQDNLNQAKELLEKLATLAPRLLDILPNVASSSYLLYGRTVEKLGCVTDVYLLAQYRAALRFAIAAKKLSLIAEICRVIAVYYERRGDQARKDLYFCLAAMLQENAAENEFQLFKLYYGKVKSDKYLLNICRQILIMLQRHHKENDKHFTKKPDFEGFMQQNTKVNNVLYYYSEPLDTETKQFIESVPTLLEQDNVIDAVKACKEFSNSRPYKELPAAKYYYASALNYLGCYYFREKKDIVAARKHLEASVNIFRSIRKQNQAPDLSEVGAFCNWLSTLMLDSAETKAFSALADFEKHFDLKTTHGQICLSYIYAFVASVYVQQDKFHQAVKYISTVENYLPKLLNEDSNFVVGAYINYGMALQQVSEPNQENDKKILRQFRLALSYALSKYEIDLIQNACLALSNFYSQRQKSTISRFFIALTNILGENASSVHFGELQTRYQSLMFSPQLREICFKICTLVQQNNRGKNGHFVQSKEFKEFITQLVRPAAKSQFWAKVPANIVHDSKQNPAVANGNRKPTTSSP